VCAEGAAAGSRRRPDSDRNGRKRLFSMVI
jgi:hypothetical protein